MACKSPGPDAQVRWMLRMAWPAMSAGYMAWNGMERMASRCALHTSTILIMVGREICVSHVGITLP